MLYWGGYINFITMGEQPSWHLERAPLIPEEALKVGWKTINALLISYIQYHTLLAIWPTPASSFPSMCYENRKTHVDLVGPRLFCCTWCLQEQLPRWLLSNIYKHTHWQNLVSFWLTQIHMLLLVPYFPWVMSCITSRLQLAGNTSHEA